MLKLTASGVVGSTSRGGGGALSGALTPWRQKPVFPLPEYWEMLGYAGFRNLPCYSGISYTFMDFPYRFPTWALYVWAFLALLFLFWSVLGFFVCFFVCFSHEKKKRISYCLKHDNKSSKSLETPTPSFLFLLKSEAPPNNATREAPSPSISHKAIKILIPQLWGKSIPAIMCALKPRLFWTEFLRCIMLKGGVLISADSNCDRGERRLLLQHLGHQDQDNSKDQRKLQ